MPTLSELAGDQQPLVGYPKTIKFGPVEVDGYMMENGEFRQSIRSTGKALGMLSNEQIQSTVVRACLTAGQDTSSGAGFAGQMEPVTADAIIVPVRSSGRPVALTINLPMVVEIWKQVALSNSKYSRQALELLGLSAVHSLERVYQEHFGVLDNRSTEDRLVEWAIRLDAGKHFELYGGQFHKHFQRVTGVAFGHRYASTCLADLVYHRLPESIYETLKDKNPVDERGWRQFTHSQMMTDEMHQQMREIVAAVTNQMANTPAKIDDPRAYAKLLHRLDKTLPRYKKRGSFKPAQKQIQESNG